MEKNKMNMTPGTISAIVCLGLVIYTVIVVSITKYNVQSKNETDEEKDDSNESYY